MQNFRLQIVPHDSITLKFRPSSASNAELLFLMEKSADRGRFNYTKQSIRTGLYKLERKGGEGRTSSLLKRGGKNWNLFYSGQKLASFREMGTRIVGILFTRFPVLVETAFTVINRGIDQLMLGNREKNSTERVWKGIFRKKDFYEKLFDKFWNWSCDYVSIWFHTWNNLIEKFGKPGIYIR